MNESRSGAFPAAPRGRVLIVDDESRVRAAIEAALSTEFEVETASDAAEARSRLASGSFDVIVADYEMPGSTGIQLLEDVAREHPTVLGILLTGHGDLKEVQAARENKHIFYVLLKGSDPKSLLSWTRQAANASRLRRSVASLKKQFS